MKKTSRAIRAALIAAATIAWPALAAAQTPPAPNPTTPSSPAPAIAPAAPAPAAPATVAPGIALPVAQPGEGQRPTAMKHENVTPGVAGPKKALTLWDRWTNFIDSELDRIDKMDLYGVTSQLPKGYLKVKWDFAMLNAGSRFDADRHLGPVMKPIDFSMNGSRAISLDMGLAGSGGGHTIQVSYGILGNFDWYVEIPFQYMNISFNPTLRPIDDAGNVINPTVASFVGITDRQHVDPRAFLAQFLPKVGRPMVGLASHGKWLLGDINTGFSWNIFRNHRMSVALTPRVFFPTGHVADPNASLTYGTGPELDTGLGGWSAGATQGYDVRIFKYSYWIDIIASSEFTVAYGFAQHRQYPNNFPCADGFDKDGKCKGNALGLALDPSGMSFPDLYYLGKGDNAKTFTYIPGWGLSWTAQLQFQVALLGLGVGYGVSYNQAPEIHADQNFMNMINSLQLTGAMMEQGVTLSASLSLLPLYIPVELGFQWHKILDGYNAIVFDNYFQFTVNTYIPINPGPPITFPPEAFPEYESRVAAERKAAESGATPAPAPVQGR